MRTLAIVSFTACAAAPLPAPPAPRPDCTTPSRACTYRAIALATPDLASYATTTYGGYGAKALATLHARGFEPLIVDAAIVQHLDAFAAFDPHVADPWLARERFAASLGKRRSYRGIVLDDAQAAEIKTLGILSPALRAHRDPLRGHLVDQVVMHVSGEAADADTMMSVSDDENIARCVAHSYARAGKHVVVFAIDIFALDVISLDASSPVCPPQPPDASIECSRLNHPPFSEPSRGMLCRTLYSPAIESFVVHRVDPSEIAGAVAPTEFGDCGDVLARASHDFHAHLELAHKACRPNGAMLPPPVETSIDAPATKP